jgi:hypothetical protein
VDAAVPPGGILGGQSEDEAAEAGGDGGSAGWGGFCGPAAGDQLAVPAQDGGRGDQEPAASADREQSGEDGDECPVGPRYSRTRGASLEYGELVAQDQDLDVLGGVGFGAQHDPAQERGEHLVDQPQRHQRIVPGQLDADEQAGHGLCAQFRAPTGPMTPPTTASDPAADARGFA